MKPFLLIPAILSLLLPVSVAADEELDRLRAAYGAAVERALGPARETYRKELNWLAEGRTRQSNLEGALAARKALQQFESAAAEAEEDEDAPGDADLDRLRKAYEDASARVVAPLRETYLRELNKIMQARTRSGDLEGALAAKAELEKATEEKELGQMDDLEALFVGRTWVSEAGTAFIFNKDGTCLRETTQRKEGTWQRRGSVVISSVPGSPLETRYFRFVSKKEAYYGNSEEAMDHPVTPR